ncbi:hypothetical protein VNI00_015282 [Paramarasmius palmivorus]|uniref:Redoxin domain-containing protein n=1 Tax=Paramarasmius palmivorus TaxID=297713 RepID=A0AAW0BLJ9_9AGAR
MTSIIASAAQTAHSAVASLLSVAQVKPGATITPPELKEDAPDKPVTVALEGKNVFVSFPKIATIDFKLTTIRFDKVFVPGAFSGTCNNQIPEYIQLAPKFKEKGVKNVFVVAVNDVFVIKAWKNFLAPEGTDVRFLADDKGHFTSSLGLLFDATGFFGAPRAKACQLDFCFVLYPTDNKLSQRAVVITEGDKVETIAVEPVPSGVTVTKAEVILAQLS